ncbi:MAG: hypothetical protein RJA52_1203, partial [Bacteroidota bacterium]
MQKSSFIEMNVYGMDCANCAQSISKYLERKDLKHVSVNFQTGEVAFQYNEEKISLEEIKKGIEKLGYKVEKQSRFDLQKKLLISSVFTAPLLIGHILMFLGFHLSWLENGWVQLLASIPVIGIGFFHFGKSALGSIKSRILNMDVLIFMGSLSAFVYSLIGLILNNPEYYFFETGATIITLVLAGNWLEKKAIQKTTSSIGELTALKTTKVKVILPSGTIIQIDRNEIKEGDIIVANEGDRIGGDGNIIKGACSLDESLITGESIPVDKSEGDFVIGGSTVVSGSIQFKVTVPDSKSFLSSIINLVKQAQQHKPNIQKLSDQISAIFVPVVLTLALCTFSVSYFMLDVDLQSAIMNSIAVLVISCPCAMGLATPTAVMVGVGKLAKNGILIKGGDTLEKFSKTKIIAFDKTGTLTTGDFKMGQMWFKNENASFYIGLILAMEKFSSHPIAQFLIQELSKIEHKSFNDFKIVTEKKGIGLFGEDNMGNIYVLGSHKILVDSPADFQDFNIYLLKNNELMAALKIDDDLRKEVRESFQDLKRRGLDIQILSGDKKSRVQKIAYELGISNFYAEQTPEEKVLQIKELRNKGITVMVGDGINDAGALSAADLGISLSNASQIAINSAQIIFLNNRFDSFKKAFDISNKTILTIKQNLFWAFSYNLVAIPLAAMGYLNPMWGAIFMAFSDLVVIGNSIRLN